MRARIPRARLAALLAAAVLGLQGCALLAVPAVGSVAASGFSSAVKSGTAAMGGGTARTFSAPLAEVYAAARATLARLDFAPPDEEIEQEHVRLTVPAIERTVRIDLQPITTGITHMTVTVKSGWLSKDPATAAELVTQIGDTLQSWPAAMTRDR